MEAASDAFTIKVVDNAMVAESVVIPEEEIDPNEIDNSSISEKFAEGTTMAVCPKCGNESIDKLQRITGYLVGTTERWNKAKLAELNDRVIHK